VQRERKKWIKLELLDWKVNGDYRNYDIEEDSDDFQSSYYDESDEYWNNLQDRPPRCYLNLCQILDTTISKSIRKSKRTVPESKNSQAERGLECQNAQAASRARPMPANIYHARSKDTNVNNKKVPEFPEQETNILVGSSKSTEKTKAPILDPKYEPFHQLIELDDGLHFTHLNGDILRESTTVVCKMSGVVCLLLWSVLLDGSYTIISVPIIDCSGHRRSHVLSHCQWLAEHIHHHVEEELTIERKEQCSHHDIFSYLTILIIRMKPEATSLLSSKFGSSMYHRRSVAVKKRFHSIKPCLDIELGSTMVDFFEDVDKADRDSSFIISRNTETLQQPALLGYQDKCIICFDEILSNDGVCLAACNHKVCSTCWM
jgi:hypothetical protein